MINGLDSWEEKKGVNEYNRGNFKLSIYIYRFFSVRHNTQTRN